MEVEAKKCVSSIKDYGFQPNTMAEPHTGKNEPDPSKDKDDQDGFIKVFVTTFATVFLAELGDKTQIATLLLSAQSGKPYIVFAGAALALICSSLVGVLIGRWLAKTLPPERLEYMAGILMLTLGIWLAIQAGQSLLQGVSPI